jgi:hypothetical protein
LSITAVEDEANPANGIKLTGIPLGTAKVGDKLTIRGHEATVTLVDEHGTVTAVESDGLLQETAREKAKQELLAAGWRPNRKDRRRALKGMQAQATKKRMAARNKQARQTA